MQQLTTVRIDIDGAVATLTLDRPDKRNAMDKTMVEDIAAATAMVQSRDDVHVLVLTGEGPSFCSGIDTRSPFSSDIEELYRAGSRQRDALNFCRKPIIAAVSGAAMGAGCELAMMCDMILADETAFFALPEISRATMPGFGGTQRLAHLVGRPRAMEICLTGRRVSAAEADRIGLVNRVVATGDLLAQARSLAQAIAAQSPLAAMMIKESVNATAELPLASGLQLEARLSQLSLGARKGAP